MKYKLPAVLAVGAFLCLIPSARAQRGGGGHGGGGGFSGHFGGGGHFSGFHSSGRASSAGSSRRGSSGPPIAGVTMAHGRGVERAAPGFHGPQPLRPRGPATVSAFNSRRGFFGYGGFGWGLGLGFCSPFDGFYGDWGLGFGCASSDFLFDPAVDYGFSGDGGDGEEPEAPADDAAADSADLSDYHPDVILDNDPPPPADKVPHHRLSAHEPDTILQLKNGSMYGLRDYWLSDGRLYYLTNYGGQNSVPLAEIDFAKTNQLNADRGSRFAVQPNS
jgi:hypothetical protein